MAIAFDAATNGQYNGGGTGHSWSHTCTGSDRFLVVCFVGDVGGGFDDITGVTYAGVSMTLAAKRTDATIIRMAYCYTLIAPATGANNVVITATNGHYMTGGSVSYTGVSQTGQPEVITDAFSESDVDSSVTNLITPATADSWIVMGGYGFDNASGAPTAGTGSTRRTYDNLTHGIYGIFDSNGPQPASSYSMTWTYPTGGADMASILVTFAPVGAGGTTLNPAQAAASLTGTSNRLGFGILMPDEL